MTPPAPVERNRSRAARSAARRRRQQRGGLIAVGSFLLLVAIAAGALYAWSRFEPPASGTVQAGAGQPRPDEGYESTQEGSTSAVPTTSSAQATVPLGPALPPGFGQPATITVAAVGDMLFDRRVERYIEANGGKAPLEVVAPRLAAADVAVGNLESVIGTTGKPVPNKEYTFLGHPKAIDGLKLAGFDALSLANNHTLDYGTEPLQETISALDSAAIAHAGAGENTDSAWAPAIVKRPGASVAFLAFTHTLPPGFLAGDDRWGVAFGRGDAERFSAAVKRAKKKYDYVIVSLHWGVEYDDNANSHQVEWGRRAIDAGADMVVGHHPHVIQGVEFYKGRLIAYSLGDFVWDHGSPKTGETFILEAEIGPAGVTNAVAHAVYLEKSTGKPEYASDKTSAVILQRLKRISARHGTKVLIRGRTARLMP